MAFANEKFRDVFCYLDDGIATGAQAVGTVSGSALQLGGPGPIRKMRFSLQAASGTASTAVVTMYLASATASGATYTSMSQTSQIASVTGSGKWFLVLDTRNEWFADLGTNAAWIKPVIVVATLALPISLETLGYLAGMKAASLLDSTTLASLQEKVLY